MKLKLVLAATIGLLIGILGGGYAGFTTSQWFVGAMFSSQIEARFIDHVMLLKLLDDGKTESVRQILLSSVQSDTVAVGSVDLPSVPDAAIETTRHRLLRFAKRSGEIPSVREDASELGKQAAEVRQQISTQD